MSSKRLAVLATAVTASSILVAAGGAANAAPQQTGQVSTDSQGRVIAVQPAAPLAAARGLAGTAAAAAQSHTAGLAEQFGVSIGDLALTSVQSIPGGSIARLQQNVAGVPVYGAQIVQDLDNSGALMAALGKTTQHTRGAFPADAKSAQDRAAKAAYGAVAAKEGAAAADLKTGAEKAYWYDASLGGDGASATAVPTYFVPVSGVDPDDKWTVVVGADSGQVLQLWGETKAATNRVVCDANRKVVDLDVATLADLRCGIGTAFSATRSEGQAAVSTADVNSVYDFFGEAQDFYSKYASYDLTSNIGADYHDGKGKALRGTVRMCEVETESDGRRHTQCPWANAFWEGEQMAFGEGVTTMDITGHELTHGVTQHTSQLGNGYAGALNEGMSDVLGQFIAIKAGDANVQGANRWLMGAGSSIGQVRDMKNPANSGEGPSPDRVNGQYWVGPNGDPHIDAGVVDKTDYLITDGATFNGQTVRGIGEDKAIALWWKVENLLRPTSTFRDLGVALNSACATNARTAVAGTTTADCTQVANAVKATQLNLAP
ncbi:M4 family metallopeptidase [Amycolatopsis sp. NPDC051903]|uniref:M4 family metallopeptidase n=1 Tax=Amycolatopsis sp. NPDC051903 TaxID=3363936 RepID=UPI003789B8A4